MAKRALAGQELFEARVNDLTEKIAAELDLDWLSVRTRFNEHPAADGGDTVAETLPHWEYRQTKIIWNSEVGITQTDEQLERVIIHELVHALLAPIWEEIPATQQNRLAKHNELATENVTRAIQAARRR